MDIDIQTLEKASKKSSADKERYQRRKVGNTPPVAGPSGVRKVGPMDKFVRKKSVPASVTLDSDKEDFVITER